VARRAYAAYGSASAGHLQVHPIHLWRGGKYRRKFPARARNACCRRRPGKRAVGLPRCAHSPFSGGDGHVSTGVVNVAKKTALAGAPECFKRHGRVPLVDRLERVKPTELDAGAKFETPLPMSLSASLLGLITRPPWADGTIYERASCGAVSAAVTPSLVKKLR
jgi:hypothetical protein